MTDRLVESLLDDRRHHIEFNGHLTNHVKHAVIALQGLGVPASVIKDYYENYARLTPYGHGLEPARPATVEISELNWAQFLGHRKHFASYCHFFDQQERELGMSRLLQRYLPKLLPGWAGAFTHATIHLGWALDIDHRWMAIEGLAYLCFTYVSCHPERLPASSQAEPPLLDAVQPIDSLLRFAEDWEQDRNGLRQWAQTLIANSETQLVDGFHPELARSGLQYRIARLLDEGHPTFYQLPSWIPSGSQPYDFEPLYFAATLLYLAKPGDFVLLHLITSLHAMEQIANRLPVDHQRQIVGCFWLGLLGIGIAGGTFPKRAKLLALRAMLEHEIDEDASLAEADWKQIAARAALEEEEHNPKLAYVLQRAWHRGGRRSLYRIAAAQFTMTPALPASFEQPSHD
ncbi:conserved hypothetical protein [Burkholderia gladioli]|uniref:Questin oxidase family protein n=1 Tax=Burkholderia gladioli (strain BSR3) TaxID=999541 RepID=F2LMD6_BURGS|nr:questin oxidase family protein [Burkholderia gladioli]AEA64220.1 hypothetical protein bgla_2g17820 [Burkholderia gladioli BSR3]MBW5286942.1 questin oxidase family protein [Burkholderia gladioli]NHH84219.1 hypothetical protein [Burkholderia gladioli]CAG9228511.1 conserved hypothetical protein [Burkholderia gladioli]